MQGQAGSIWKVLQSTWTHHDSWTRPDFCHKADWKCIHNMQYCSTKCRPTWPWAVILICLVTTLPLEFVALEPSIQDQLGVALGYVAQLVHHLASTLSVPLQYPLHLNGSKSSIYDYISDISAVQNNREYVCSVCLWFGWLTGSERRKEVVSEGRGKEGREGGRLWEREGGCGEGEREREVPLTHLLCFLSSHSSSLFFLLFSFPLFPRGSEKEVFMYAVYLLNKDVCQLRQYSGIGASKSNFKHTLPNLKSLVDKLSRPM